MRLKNKLTGEIKEVIVGGYPVSGKTKMWKCSEMDANEETGYKTLGTYSSLAELNADWEDAPEEPKEYWYIDCDGEVYSNDRLIGFDLDRMLNIGNCFNTREEAEKAVEKLKAWKRLEDKGFRLKMWEWEFIYNDNISGELIIKAHIDDATDSDGKYTKDLDLLFCTEENS